MTARTDQVHSIRNARDARIAGLGDGGKVSLVASGRLADFRCAYGKVADGTEGVTLDPATAEMLRVGSGDVVRWIER